MRDSSGSTRECSTIFLNFIWFSGYFFQFHPSLADVFSKDAALLKKAAAKNGGAKPKLLQLSKIAPKVGAKLKQGSVKGAEALTKQASGIQVKAIRDATIPKNKIALIKNHAANLKQQQMPSAKGIKKYFEQKNLNWERALPK